jgi:hypothetical protein
MKLSATDQRVIAHLRGRPRATLAALAAACFTLSGKPRGSAVLPTAAHLARMEQRRLVRRDGQHYLLEPEVVEPGLFEPPLSVARP